MSMEICLASKRYLLPMNIQEMCAVKGLQQQNIKCSSLSWFDISLKRSTVYSKLKSNTYTDSPFIQEVWIMWRRSIEYTFEMHFPLHILSKVNLYLSLFRETPVSNGNSISTLLNHRITLNFMTLLPKTFSFSCIHMSLISSLTSVCLLLSSSLRESVTWCVQTSTLLNSV